MIHTYTEGAATYHALLFIPAKAPYNYYTRDYEKGLKLYASGVLIMDSCKDLLPDHFSFVKGLVDSEDLSLNISREMLQHDRQLKVIASRLEKKIKSELLSMLKMTAKSMRSSSRTLAFNSNTACITASARIKSCFRICCCSIRAASRSSLRSRNTFLA